ncbi:MAG: superoxide dismutase [bacterium]|nr:superoxide dismutase [bacterium]MDZ4342320.1 superoxide dismutase [Candidatus Binatia bacterium]
MAFQLPELPYAYGALEPYIDARTMEVHHTKHHQAYTDKLNAALSRQSDLAGKSIEDILTDLSQVPEDIRTSVRNNGGGYANHNFFWSIMAPDRGGEPSGKIADAINQSFDSFSGFKQQLTDAATGQFGSGWAWLVAEMSGALKIMSTPNQDSPLSEGLTPLLAIDVWEHAYYLKYQNRRPEYIDAFWNVINWNAVEHRYKKVQ